MTSPATSYAATTDAASATPSARTTFLRWMASFPGFPLGGLAAMLVVGPVDGPTSAVLGGLVTGAVLGGAQSFGQRIGGRDAAAWTIATSLGLGVGLATGAGLVGFGASLGDLVVQGIVSGATVGLFQAVLVVRRGSLLGYAWPFYLAAAWALGWTLTTLVGVQVEDQFTVFGAAGAVTVTTLTSVLPLVTGRSAR